MTETKIRPMTLVDYIDPGSGVPVKACSPDNGQTYKIYFTPWGIVWHADDVEVLWNDFLLDKVKSVMSIDWDSIQNKPKLVTQDQLNERLAKLSVPTIDWSDIQNKPDLSQYVTRDELPAQPDLSGYAKTSDIPKSMTWNQITDKPSLALTSDIPSLDGYAKLTDIPSVSGLVKETELADYAKKSDLPTMPDLSGYATISSLIDYVKKTDLPDFSKYALKNELSLTMAWQNITGKPDLATQDDLKNIELKPGPQGLPGKDGVTPHIDSTTGDWFVGNQDTGTQAQGPAGKNGRDGVDGQPGKDGQNGITPHIDTATGNWFVGSTDTGIKAQGPQGIQGVPGKDGRNGIDGKDGDRGPQGLPGANGKDGSPGAPGSPGRDGTDGKSAYQIWLDNGHSGTETDFLNSLKGAKGDPGKDGKDGQSPDTSIFATKTEVQQAQTTADNASQYASNDDKLIKQLSGRIDAIKMPDLSGYAKTSQIPTDVVTHAELTTTKWLDTGTTWLNGNTGSIQYRSITIGNYHIVEVTGSMYITTKAYAITSAFKIPLLGFEDRTTMHFSGGSTITNEIPVAFMAGDPGEAKLYTWQNVNHGWTEVHLSWTYVGGD